MWSELRAERVHRGIVAACAGGLHALELLDHVASLVDEAVPADASCWSTFDPATTMVTAAIGRDLDETGDGAARFFELEYAVDGPGQYRHLAACGAATVVLDASDPSADDAAATMRDHLHLLGLRQELRVLLHHSDAGWGVPG